MNVLFISFLFLGLGCFENGCKFHNCFFIYTECYVTKLKDQKSRKFNFGMEKKDCEKKQI